MKHDDFDEKLYKYFAENKEVPQKFKDTINNVNLKKDSKCVFNMFNFKKAAVAAVSLVTISTGVVFAKDIEKFVKNIFKDNQAVNIATKNGYVYENPEKIVSESENIKTRIQEMIMDDYTLDLNLIVEFDENTDITGIEHFEMPDMIITDDMNNILYCKNNSVIEAYCNKNNISYDYETVKKMSINTDANIFIWNADKNFGTISCNLSTSDTKFPQSKKIYIKFNTIKMQGNNKDYTFTGNWENEITVPNKFINRQSTMYKVTSCNNSNVYTDSIKAEVYETGMKFEMSMYWGDYETWHQKTEELRKTNVLSSQLIKQEESYVVNEKGNKFYPAQSSQTDSICGLTTDGNLHKSETFSLTKYDMTNKLTVVLTTISNEQIIIELEK